MSRNSWLIFGAMALVACGGPSEPADAAVAVDAAETNIDAGSTSRCERDLDCDNGAYCDGVERCRPGEDGADPTTGCVAGESPCEAGSVCDEEADRCEACTDENRDMDGDFAISNACGGPDCDDTNPSIFPDAEEICDAAGVDEDCNEESFGPAEPGAVGGDADGDSFVSAMCCQVTRAGFQCGDDCDDDNREVNPDASEICNGVDDDCDGALDPVLEDRDADGWAGCADLPDGMRDCDETNPLTYPGAAERCDGEDNDCDGSAAGEDIDRDDHLGIDVVCEAGPLADLPRTDCDDDDDAISPTATELCDAIDQDCDSSTDETPAVASCPDDGVTTYACNAGTCEVASCAATHDDCNVDDADGCEQPLSVRDHCGACGTQCQWTCEAGPACDDPVAISAGAFHVCALTTSGRVRCWGRNDAGQLGTGTASASPTARPGPYVVYRTSGGALLPLEDVTHIASGTFFSCAAAATGVYCWGRNDHGQLGNGAAGADQPAAIRVPIGTASTSNVSDLAVGERHACATHGGGFVTCWGDNRRAQVGGALSSAKAPYQVWSGGVVEIALGDAHSCLLTATGDPYCWGDDNVGQVGDDGAVSTLPVGNPRRVVSESGSSFLTDYDGLRVGSNHACVYRGSGARIRCWGAGAVLPVAPTPPSGSIGWGGFEANDTSQPFVFGRILTSWTSSELVRFGYDGSGAFGAQSFGDTTVDEPMRDVLWTTGTSAEPAGTICLLHEPGLQCVGTNAYGEAGNGTTTPPSTWSLVLPPSA